MRTPNELIADVERALEADTRFEIDDLVVEMNVDTGTVTVSGRVSDIRAKRLAANQVRLVVGTDADVRDHIRVAAHVAGDLALRDAVAKLFSAEHMFSDLTLTIEAGSHHDILHHGAGDAGRVDVRVDGSTVVLRGEVPSLGLRRFAEVLVWWTGACERVDNCLEVKPPQEDRDNDLTDLIRVVFDKDPLVRGEQLNVGTAGGVVEIRGLVRSEEERRLALHDIWYVPGVWDVVDRIQVQP